MVKCHLSAESFLRSKHNISVFIRRSDKLSQVLWGGKQTFQISECVMAVRGGEVVQVLTGLPPVAEHVSGDGLLGRRPLDGHVAAPPLRHRDVAGALWGLCKGDGPIERLPPRMDQNVRLKKLRIARIKTGESRKSGRKGAGED